MKRMKISAMFIAIILVAGVFAGCGAKPGEADDNSKRVMTESIDTKNEGIENEAGTVLGTYGLYNVAAQEGFSGNMISGDTADIDAELAVLEEEAQQMNDRLQEGTLSQIEMNQLSNELFQLWDNELNSLWERLKEKLDADAMAQLTEEEREWIKWKDQEVKAAGSEMEGGSMQPLLENDKAAELTRKRVYELAERLKSE